MYSVVLVAALVTTTTTPTWGWANRGHGCYSCSCSCYGGYSGYSGYACYSGYSCYSPYGCYGCTNLVHGYGCAGACYGYTGGCYGGWGVIVADPHYYCSGCYGCYGGYSCYGVPVPVMPPVVVPEGKGKDQFPPINPGAGKDKDKLPEVVPPPGEKKKDKDKGKDQARAQLNIEIPQGGRLFVDGQAIPTAPGTRTFQTPVLSAGQAYFYDIRIEVDRQGAVHTEHRRIVIRGGDDIAVNFPNLKSSGTQTASGDR